MGMRIIPVRVENEYVIGAGVPAGAAGSHDDVALRLSFSGDMWEGTSKTVIWTDALGQNTATTELTNELLAPGETDVYVVPIPAAPKTYPGRMRMSVTGVTESGETELAATYSAAAEFIILESVQVSAQTVSAQTVSAQTVSAAAVEENN